MRTTLVLVVLTLVVSLMLAVLAGVRVPITANPVQKDFPVQSVGHVYPPLLT